MTERRSGPDRGNAVVEFVWLTVLLMVPLLYVVLTGVAVQRAAFGLTDAAREAARAYATAGSDRLGESRAEAATALALRDQGVNWTSGGRIVSCGSCTYSPGSTFVVELHAQVDLPLLPGWICGNRCRGGVTVTARHSEVISCYGGTGEPEPGSSC